MKLTTTIMALTAITSITGCVSPDVVASQKATDANMSCADIAQNSAALEEIRTDAQRGKTVSGANVAAAIFFWPAIIGNNMNANQAIEAANNREIVLARLAQEKGC